MKISECTYCGMLAITNQQDICASCEAFVAPEPVAQNAEPPETGIQPEINPFLQTSPTAPMTAYPATPNNQYVPQPNFQEAQPNFQERRSSPNSHQPESLDSSCVKCGAAVPRGQRACLDC